MRVGDEMTLKKAGKRIRKAWKVNELPIKDFRIFLNCVKTVWLDDGIRIYPGFPKQKSFFMKSL